VTFDLCHYQKTNIQQFIMAHRNNFSQYYLLRNGAVAPVSLLDGPQMIGLDNMDAQQAMISNWQAGISMAVYARDSFMEPLPSQAIRFESVTSNNRKDPLIFKNQSKDGFKQFHLTKM
jgi:hypothetical protein